MIRKGQELLYGQRCRSCGKLLDVPRKKADALISDPEWCDKIEIINDIPQTINRDDLIAERNRLAARINEIDTILHQE